jgi:hypothetical protein
MRDTTSDRSLVTACILEGEHPIAAWRHCRKLGCEALAAATGIDLPRIYALDYEEMPTAAELERLAMALGAPRDLLIASQDDSVGFGGDDLEA